MSAPDDTQQPPEGWLSVGHFRRAHGLRGDVFVQLTTDRRERVEPGAELFASGRRFTVRSGRQAGNGRMIVSLDGIDDRTAAERLTNIEVFAAPIHDPEALWAHELIGTRVVDQHGVDHGPCVALVANPASDLLELESGALVPSVFVVRVADGTTVVDVPDGLFDDAEAAT